MLPNQFEEDTGDPSEVTTKALDIAAERLGGTVRDDGDGDATPARKGAKKYRKGTDGGKSGRNDASADPLLSGLKVIGRDVLDFGGKASCQDERPDLAWEACSRLQ